MTEPESIHDERFQSELEEHSIPPGCVDSYEMTRSAEDKQDVVNSDFIEHLAAATGAEP